MPDEFKRHAHHWLILHGRYVCVARKPKCPVCTIADLCDTAKTKTAQMPGSMFNSSRDEARRFLIEAWVEAPRRDPALGPRTNRPEIIALHPEYHGRSKRRR